MSDTTIWVLAVTLIAVDLIVFMIPVVPVAVAYVLVARPPWFKRFIDALYEES